MFNAILGIDVSASNDDIKRAFRMKSLEGENDFDELANAYKELMNTKNIMEQYSEPHDHYKQNFAQQTPIPFIPDNKETLPVDFLSSMLGIHLTPPTKEEKHHMKKVLQNAMKEFMDVAVDSSSNNIADAKIVNIEKDIKIGDIFYHKHIGRLLKVEDLIHIDYNDFQFDKENTFYVSNNTEQYEYKIKITTMKENNYSIVDNSLYYTIPISLKDALCGFSHTLQHLDGKEYTLKNTKTIIHPESEIKLPGMGLYKDDTRESLIIRFCIEFPTELTDESKEQISNML